jgi:hypothetical protein
MRLDVRLGACKVIHVPHSQPHSQTDVGVDLCQVLVESYAVNERMNQIILEHLDPAAWRAKLPGSRGRTIAAIFAHVHNVRRKWLRLSTWFQHTLRSQPSHCQNDAELCVATHHSSVSLGCPFQRIRFNHWPNAG